MSAEPRTPGADTDPLRRAAAAVEQFFFAPSDPRLLGLMRLCVGFLVLYIHLAYTVDFQEFFGKDAWVDEQAIKEARHDWPWGTMPAGWDFPHLSPPTDPKQAAAEREYAEWWGMNPRLVYAKGQYVWSVWFHVTDPRAMLAVHGAILAVMLLFAIGFCTRVTAVLTWIGMISYIQRGQTTLFGMDTMMNLLVLYLTIAPCGAALSVDRLIGRYWRTWRALRDRRPVPEEAPPAPRVSATLALRMIQINLCIIYLAAGLSKLQGNAWWSQTAVWGTMANPEFSPTQYDLYLGFLRLLCRHRWMWELFMAGGVLFTLAMEIGFPFLIWNRRLRWVMLSAGVMLHTGIALFMGLNTFSLFMIVFLMSFVPLPAVDRLLRLPGEGAPHLRVLVNGRARRQVRAASLARAFDAWGQLDVTDAAAGKRARAGEPRPALNGTPEPEGLEVIPPDGAARTGYDAFRELTRSLRLLWPVAALTFVPGVEQVGRALWPSRHPPADAEAHAGQGEAVHR